MANRTIDDACLHTPKASAYFATSDRRILIGFRMALEMLDIPIPAYASRQTSGRRALADLMAAVDRDTGTIATYNDEKKRIGVFAPKNPR